MPKKINSKSTRAEILEAYEELNALYQALETKFADMTVMTQKSVVQPVVTKTVAAETEAKSIPSNNHVQARMEAVITALGALGEKFNAALSHLSTNLLVEAGRLQEVSTQVEEESQRLATLYHLQIEEDTLSQLLKQYAETAQTYAETFKQQQETVEKTFAEKNKAWQQERDETMQQWRDQQATDKKELEREETEYRYNLQLQREVSDEEYVQRQKQQQQVLQNLEETQQKAWAEQGKTLAEREQQFRELKEKVEKFPKELEAALKKAKEEGIGIARHQAKIKADFLAKEVAGEEEVFRLKIVALESEVAQQTVQIDKLSQQLETAQKQAQELAVKALEGASSYTSFQALKEIALEQAKGQAKAK